MSDNKPPFQAKGSAKRDPKSTIRELAEMGAWHDPRCSTPPSSQQPQAISVDLLSLVQTESLRIREVG